MTSHRVIPSETPLRLVFLGCGNITRRHATLIRKRFRDVQLYFASRDGTKAGQFSRELGGAGSYAGYASALADSSIHVAFVATPTAQHLELTLAALAAGKDVIVEKPPFMKSSDFDQVEAAMASAGRRVLVAENYFYRPLTRKLRNLLTSGAVGEVRYLIVKALKEQKTGGWRDDALAEDTDLTYRLLLRGWKTTYQNRSECYEEVPETWPVRVRQIMRWSKGHNQAAFRYAWRTLVSRRVRALERLDALLLLGVYLLAPLLLLGFVAAFALYLLGAPLLPGGLLLVAGLACFSALGNYAAFFEIAAALHLDGSRRRLRLLPLNFINFLVSFVNITRACVTLVISDTLLKRDLRWDKTARYRRNGTS